MFKIFLNIYMISDENIIFIRNLDMSNTIYKNLDMSNTIYKKPRYEQYNL